jgi:segregation and condensation protein B
MEAVLFAAGGVVRWAQWQNRFAWDRVQATTHAQGLARALQDRGSALTVVVGEEGVALATVPEGSDMLDTFFGRSADEPLSRPALETLALLAYRGPLTRPQLDVVRGVHCGMILRHLLLRGLVEELEGGEGTLMEPRYGVTAACLEILGVPSCEALPDFEAWKANAVIGQVLEPPTV